MTDNRTTIGTEHPDAAAYRRAADAFRDQDLEILAETIHEDVTWHVPGSSWLAREIVGRDAVLAVLGEIVERTGGTFTLEDVLVSGCDDHVLAVQRFGAAEGGERQVFDATSVMRFVDGRQHERWFHIHEQAAFDAFMARFA